MKQYITVNWWLIKPESQLLLLEVYFSIYVYSDVKFAVFGLWIGIIERQGTNQLSDNGQLKIKEIHSIKNTFPRNYDDNTRHVNATKAIIFQFFIHLARIVFYLVKFHCFKNPFVPNLEAKSMVTELTTIDG